VSIELIFRIIGALVFGGAGWYFGSTLSLPIAVADWLPLEFVGAAVGLIGGFLVTPYLTTRPAAFVVDHSRRLHVKDLAAAVLGLLVALVLSALLAVPLSLLPGLFGRVLPFAGCLFLVYLGITIAVGRRDEIFGLLGLFGGGAEKVEADAAGGRAVGTLLDTSAIIDGRIADISRVGFLADPVLVPRFVLRELQRIADSPDPIRRGRGRRGLELLDRLKSTSTVPVKIYDGDVDGDGVDAKLVCLAQKLKCPIVTNDYNLNRVAAVQGVRVLNVNELANAVKTTVLPGEELDLRIIQEGKEPGQGVGYLDDGTMVVVDGGRHLVESDVTVIVTRVLQTAAGRMIFAQTRDGSREVHRASRSSA
jgi:uncharacterized protein YacL